MGNLSIKHRLFCENYITDRNGAKAYRKVYGVEDKVARVNASRLLKKDDIQEYIKELGAEHAKKCLWTREQAERDLINLKNRALELAIEEKADEDGNVRSVLSHKVANTAIAAIKELNLMNGFNQSNIELDTKDIEITVTTKRE